MSEMLLIVKVFFPLYLRPIILILKKKDKELLKLFSNKQQQNTSKYRQQHKLLVNFASFGHL